MGVSAKNAKAAAGKPRAGARGPTEQDAIRAFVENTPLAVAMTDDKLRFLAVSPQWLADFTMPGQQVIGMTSYEAAPDTEKFRIAHSRVLAGETLRGEPELVLLPGGERRWMSWNASPWREKDGRIGGVLLISRDMTDLVEAQDEARRSRALNSVIVEHSPLPMVVKDAKGRVLLMNRAMQKLYGVYEDDHRGRTVHQVMDEQTARAVAEEDRRALATGEPIVVEERRPLRGSEGERIIRKTKAAIRDDDGVAYIVAISEDVTETRRTQETLERTRAFLETVIDNIPVGLTVKSASNRKLLLANQAVTEIFGFDRRDQNLGRTNEEVFEGEQARRLSERERDLVQNGGSRFYEGDPIETPRGVRYINQLKTLVHGAHAEDYLLTITEDVTERKQVLDELQRTRAFLETVIESMPAGITVKDAATGKLLISNPAVDEIFGVDRGESLGRTLQEVFSPEQAADFARQDREAVESGETRVYEDHPVETRAGRKFLRRKKVLIRNADGPDYLLGISEDVTERKLAQDALKEALARAEAASVSKSEFLANMSHEIRTPLNGVLGLADALARMELTPQQREIVDMIVSSGHALTAILSDVLDLAKAEAGQLQLSSDPFSLRETIGSAAFLFQTVARDKGVDFKVKFDARGPDRLLGDPLRIRQVVSNLISNAVKFTSEGEVRISVASRIAADGSARISVKVKDTGPGFSEEVRSRLFSRFEQGDGSVTRRYGGTGLGLSIASALAQKMGGQIDCRAKPDEGATFIFRARLEVDAVPRAAPATAQGPAPVGLDHAPRVLLAEDHEVNQKVVQLMLGDMADLVIVPDGRQAVEQAMGPVPFDVVLMDTQMPVMDGLSATRRIREEEIRLGRARTPIISLTANAMAHQVKAALDAGADCHLAKPITAEALYDAIERMLALSAACAEAAVA
jgi:PAS domain S-box-containing protein